MVARNLENTIAEAIRIERRAGQLPAIGGYANYFPWTRDNRADLQSTTVTQKYSYNFSVNQPLYHWGSLQNSTRIGELQLKMAQGQTVEVYRLLAQEIRTQFLQLILKKARMAQTRLGQQQAEEQFAVAKSNLENNTIAPSAIFFPDVALEQARLALDRAVEDYETSKAGLARLCGCDPYTEDDIPDAIPGVQPNRDIWPSMLAEFAGPAEPRSYSIQNIQRQLEVARLEYRIASVRLRPKLNLLIGTSQDEISYSANIAARSKVQSLFTGATVNWSIFDGFATRAQKMSSLARIRQLEQAFRDMSAEARETARAKLRQLEFAARSLELSERMFNVAAGGYNARKEDLVRGLASRADVRAAEIAFAGSQIETYVARGDYLLKVTDFLSSILRDPALANLPKPLQ